ncbi:facilitated trehalose transporter Tret1-like [Adelges cooleyi]|uniref:facilitated trehalose transporter Tret1-like n=1 Tax=Adelges cooleyi TaxID=133065 RepID=UPI0021807933|nr:facilitated trehalose transporter Tret1-like [Adelges cooleyi]XP_050432007.1 facilitated trehalose transporter Tret1-like [Adelges cooleyi]XP_050432008.1 facilitated trehalose transporter Tret1-like [Adelges cooleyi]
MKTGTEYSYGLKSTFAQCLMLTTTYLFNISQGIDIMIPTVIVGSIRENNDKYLPNVSDEQLSWIASLVYLSPPLGSLFLSVFQNFLGHRICMFITCLIQVSSVSVVFLSHDVQAIYWCTILMGLSTGFATNLNGSYSGEVCEPRLRGMLTSLLNVFFFSGYLFVSVVYAITLNWRFSLLITVAIPLMNLVVLIFTVDSPMWLLSRGKVEKAKRSLRKLRGNASEEKCAFEFKEMVEYVLKKSADKVEHLKDGSLQTTDLINDLDDLWKPLTLMVVFIFFSNIMSGVPYTPYLLSIFKILKTPFDSAWAMTVYTGFAIIGNVLTIFMVHKFGKRFLVLLSYSVCSISYIGIGVIGTYAPVCLLTSWIQVTLFYLTSFASSLGIAPIVWILMCEVFPMKSKCIGCGISASTYFLLSFVMTKFYTNFELLAGFYNTFVIFGTLGVVGLIYLYKELPETENRTLKEISDFFKTVPVKF